MFTLKAILFCSVAAIGVSTVVAAPACTTKFAGGVNNVVEGPRLNDVDRTYICTDGVLRPVPMMVDGHFCPDEDLPSDPASFPMATQDVVRSRFSPEQRMQICQTAKQMNCGHMQGLDATSRKVCTLRQNGRHDPVINLDGAAADAMLNMALSFATGSGSAPVPATTMSSSSESSEMTETTMLPGTASDSMPDSYTMTASL
ncbi:hypothetical protein GGG16DRAFT_59438 [Schizophyllum commune]